MFYLNGYVKQTILVKNNASSPPVIDCVHVKTFKPRFAFSLQIICCCAVKDKEVVCYCLNYIANFTDIVSLVLPTQPTTISNLEVREFSRLVFN